VIDDRDARPQFDAALRLYDLALDYSERSHAAEAELVRAFEAEAAALAHEVGELVVEDDDDERLIFTARGRFAGQVLLGDPAPGWQALDSPDDIVEHYDPVDLFADLANAIAEAFPGVDDQGMPAEALDHARLVAADEVPAAATQEWSFLAPPGDDIGDAGAPPNSPGAHESEMLRVLKDLHVAGVLTDTEFEAKKAELDPQP